VDSLTLTLTTMRKLTFFLILLIPVVLFSQNCLPDGITFSTQEQIDSFPINYPNCREIEGSVIIMGNDITNLDSLFSIESIGGSLKVESADSLLNLKGLDSLEILFGDLFISECYSLQSLHGLDNLNLIEGSLILGYSEEGPPPAPTGNASLESIESLRNITSIGGGLSTWGNNVLTDLEGLNNVSSIGGGMAIQVSSLTTLSGLEQLTTLGGPLHLYANSSLTDFSGLNNLETIDGDLVIARNNILITLIGLNSLTTINGKIRIGGGQWGNPELISLEGIEKIKSESIQELEIEGNFSLTNCDIISICEYLSNPGETIEIGYNATGCNSQEEVLDSCWTSINEQWILTDLRTLPNPFPESTTIEYTLNTSQTVTITFYNQFGKQIDVIEQKQSSGKQQMMWTPELPGGVYFFRLDAGEQQAYGKMILVE